MAYPVALGVVAGALCGIGEAHWATTVGLYLPAVAYLLPALPCAVLALWVGPRWLWGAPILGALIALGPLMGFCWGGIRSATAGETQLRVLSYNVDSSRADKAAALEGILAADADIVLLQEADYGRDEWVELLRAHYPVVEGSTQFVLASRHPVLETTEPPRIPYGDGRRSPRFLRHVLETPLGVVVLYNVHPLSPRESLGAVRGEGLRRELASGRLFRGEKREVVEANTGLRVLQAEAIARGVQGETRPVIVAGDTNLPGPSPLFRRTLGSLQDGFAEVGWGFGYTFPTKFPFLRLDRILASDELRFVRVTVGCGRVSDHHCVIADLTGKI